MLQQRPMEPYALVLEIIGFLPKNHYAGHPGFQKDLLDTLRPFSVQTSKMCYLIALTC